MKSFLFVVAFLTITILAMAQNDTGEGGRLKILIPVRSFTDFVSYEIDPITGVYNFSGFAVEVFQAVMYTALTRRVDFDFVAYATPNGSMNGTFDQMLEKVSSSEEYAGAAGEISILHSRTRWVNFTMPYLDTSISMLVRKKQAPTKSGLGRVTEYVVASSLGLSFVVALLFWFLEYKNDKHASRDINANSSPGQSSTNHDDDWRREMKGSIIQTRLVMILFFMVLLVLIACYTASQTSSLANQPPSGAFKNLNELKRKGANIGYREGSFIRDMLIEKGIDESKLKILRTDEEIVSMLSKGSDQDGVDAIIGDAPTLKLLVAKHCGVFTIVPTYNLHAAGFGFAFRKDFSQLSEVSNGILKIIDKGNLAKIQERTIGMLEGCPSEANATALDSGIIWILISGAIAVFLLLIIVLLVYCGSTCNTKSKKSVAYPCYLSPCC